MLRKENEIIADTKKIVQVLNDHYTDIVVRSSVKDLTTIQDLVTN